MIIPQRTVEIGRAVEIIKQGRVVAFPTGTSYGLAADTLQGFALQRVRNLKERPAEKSFTIFLAPARWDQFLNVTEAEQQIMEAFAGKPLTLLVTPKDALAHLAQDGLVGVRSIDHPLMQALAEAVDVPLTATSANKNGQPPCFSPAEIIKQFPSQLDETTYDLSLGCILDGGELTQNPPTTIAKLEGKGNNIVIVRPGAITREQLESVVHVR